MTKDKIIVGLVAAPGLPQNLAYILENELPETLSEYINSDVEWKINLTIDPLTGSAESVERIYEKTNDYNQSNKWDYTICITDLPVFQEKYVVAVDINKDTGTSLISLPSYGWRPMKRRAKHTIVGIIKEVNQYKQKNKEPETSHELMDSQFPLSSLKRTSKYVENTKSEHTQYLVSNKIFGAFRLVSGMTFANNPLNMMSSLSSVVAIAFTTGAFGIVFTTMWNLSYVYSEWRLICMTIVAVLGMMIWTIVAHRLWEPIKQSEDRRITRLYNFTTVSTLAVSLIIYYVILLILFLVAALVILPPDYLGQTLKMGRSADFITFFNLAWFAASISTVAGAIGAGLNNEELILESTYGYRQKMRYKRIKELREEKEQQEAEIEEEDKAEQQEKKQGNQDQTVYNTNENQGK